MDCDERLTLEAGFLDHFELDYSSEWTDREREASIIVDVSQMPERLLVFDKLRVNGGIVAG